jgi:microcystin-dependent protein
VKVKGDLEVTRNITADNLSGTNTGDQEGDGVTITGIGTPEDPFVAVAGSGDVIAPASNTDGNIPQWNGADSKTLKDGLGLETSITEVDTAVPTSQAVKTYADGKIAKTTYIESLNETDIADGQIAVFNKTNKDIRTSGKTIVTTLGSDDTTVPTSKSVKDYVYNTPAGSVTAFAGSSIPTGYLNCDGSAVSRETYASLFDAIGTTWGAGDGSTTFNLPDLRSATLRGVGTPTAFTSNTVIALADKVDDAMQGHYHYLYNYAYNWKNSSSGTPGSGKISLGSTYWFNYSNMLVQYPTTNGTNGTPRTASETTGKAYGVYHIIKY